MDYILVGIGGIFGSISRFALGKFISKQTKTIFPVGTFIINITGAFLLGVVSAHQDKSFYLLFGDGFLGAYTTFSTFMYEGFSLFKNNKKLNAFIYISCSLILGVLGFISGSKF